MAGGLGARRRPAGAVSSWLAALARTVAVAVSLPLVYLLLRALEGGWRTAAAAVFSPLTLRLTLHTLALVVGVLALALPLAVGSAWLVVRTDLPGRRLWAVLAALPLVFPSYVAALGWVAVLGPRGLVGDWLGIERLPEVVYGYPGALLVLALFTHPYVYLQCVAALRLMDGSVEEASRSLGRGRWSTFFGAVLPRLGPAVYSGSLLVALYVLSDFGAVSILGYNTFTLAIYNAYRTLFDRSVAASLSLALVALTVGFIALESLATRRLRPAGGHRLRPPRAVPLGRWRLPALAGMALVATANLGVPLTMVAVWGWRGLGEARATAGILRLAANSVEVALAAAVAALALAVPIAVWRARENGRMARATHGLAFSGYALPGLVVALALVFFAVRAAPWLYQTAVLLVGAYVVRFLPAAIAAVRSAVAGLSPRWEEAARSLGRSAHAVLWTITLPLVRPGLLAGGGLVFLSAMKELPATLILRPTGFETLATAIWSAASEGIYSAAALPALCLVLASALPVYALIIKPALPAGPGE